MADKSRNNLVICIDFDGTIVDHAYPEIGKPVPLAIYYLKQLQDAGIKLILYTMRHGQYLDEAVQYLKDNDIQLFGANENPDQYTWTDSNKVYGDLYIDDAAFGCPLLEGEIGFNRPCVNWSIVGPAILRDLGIPVG